MSVSKMQNTIGIRLLICGAILIANKKESPDKHTNNMPSRVCLLVAINAIPLVSHMLLKKIDVM